MTDVPAPLPELGAPSHVCLVVPDRERAIAELTPSLGAWVRQPPRPGGRRLRLASGAEVTVHFVVAWTLAGPVHVEVIQGMPGTVWEPRAAGYLHHVGYRVDALADASARLVAAGMTLEVTRWDPSGRPTGFAYHTSPAGLRVEVAEEGPPQTLAAMAPPAESTEGLA